MKRSCLFILFLLLLMGSACENNSHLDDLSSIQVVGIGSAYSGIGVEELVLFSGNDILWFNPNTREIRFREGFAEKTLSLYDTILFKLSEMELFTAHVVSDIASVSYEDMVLYHNLENNRYYLHDSYPDWINTEAVRLNEEIRSENWTRFLIQLAKEGRLKE